MVEEKAGRVGVRQTGVSRDLRFPRSRKAGEYDARNSGVGCLELGVVARGGGRQWLT